MVGNTMWTLEYEATILLDAPLSDGIPANICIYLIYLAARFIGRHYAADSRDLCWNFYGGFRKNIVFLQEWRLGRRRSSKVIDFGTNQKHICDFLLVRHSNLHRFGDFAAVLCSWPHPYST